MKDLKKLLESVGLSEEHQQLLESGITEIVSEKVVKEVNEQVAIKEDLLKEQYAAASEKYIEEQLAEQVEATTTQLTEKFEQDKVEFENKMVDYFDQFLENEINENVSEEILTKIAINESLKPVVEGIKKVFAEQGFDVGSDAQKIIGELNEKVETYKKQLDEKINENVQLAMIGSKAAAQIKIIEITKDLPATIAEQVVELYGDKSFDEINEKAEKYASMLLEQHIQKENTEKVLEEKVETIIDDVAKPKKNTLFSEAARFVGK